MSSLINFVQPQVKCRFFFLGSLTLSRKRQFEPFTMVNEISSGFYQYFLSYRIQKEQKLLSTRRTLLQWSGSSFFWDIKAETGWKIFIFLSDFFESASISSRQRNYRHYKFHSFTRIYIIHFVCRSYSEVAFWCFEISVLSRWRKDDQKTGEKTINFWKTSQHFKNTFPTDLEFILSIKFQWWIPNQFVHFSQRISRSSASKYSTKIDCNFPLLHLRKERTTAVQCNTEKQLNFQYFEPIKRLSFVTPECTLSMWSWIF